LMQLTHNRLSLLYGISVHGLLLHLLLLQNFLQLLVCGY
jgi:hypothetical protein